MLALGLKKVLGYAGDGSALSKPIYGVSLAVLLGGTTLYLLAHVGFKAYVTGSVNRERVGVAALLLALIPAMAALPALVTLAALAAVHIVLITYEAVRFAEQRHTIRHDTAHGHWRPDCRWRVLSCQPWLDSPASARGWPLSAADSSSSCCGPAQTPRSLRNRATPPSWRPG